MLDTGHLPDILVNPETGQIFQNPEEIALAIGQIALKPLIEILSDSFPLDELATSLDRPDSSSWTKESVLTRARQITALLRSSASNHDVPERITENTATKLNRLGLMPNQRVVGRFFGTLSALQCMLGSKGEHFRGQYDQWTIDHYVQYIAKIGAELGRRPTRFDITNAHNEGRGPSMEQVRKFGLGKVQELAGYVNTRRWQEEDYINWGVLFMRANGNRAIINKSAVMELSKKGIAPGECSIRKYFGSFPNFREHVTHKYLEYMEARQINLEVARNLFDAGMLELSADEDIGLMEAARLRVAQKNFFPAFPPQSAGEL